MFDPARTGAHDPWGDARLAALVLRTTSEPQWFDLGPASVIEKLGLHSTAFHIGCVGSVFRSGEVVLQPLREAVLSVAPRAEIGPPLYPPAIGAAKLARELA